jgi:hypothetical protein
MKTTKTGYRISKTGKVITSTESDAFKSFEFLGNTTKQNGTYYFFDRKQGSVFVYLP